MRGAVALKDLLPLLSSTCIFMHMEGPRKWSHEGKEYSGEKPQNYLAFLHNANILARKNSPFLFDELQGGLKEVVNTLIFRGPEEGLIDATTREVIGAIDELTKEHRWKKIEDVDLDAIRARFPKSIS